MQNNCVQCGHELAEGAKFCPECGAKQQIKCPGCGASLDAAVKFCGECGAKVSAGGTAVGGGEVASIALSPLPPGLAECRIAIKEITGEGPDEDGSLRITVKYEVHNDTSDDWDYLEVRTQLLNAGGQIIEETRDTREEAIGAGEQAELESGFWGLKAKALGAHPEKAHVVVSVTACGLGQQALGELALPEAAYDTLALKPAKVGDILQLVSGSLWKEAPDEDKDSRIEVKLLVQNLSMLYLPQVKLMAEVTDKAGRELTDAGGYGEVQPGSLCMISGYGSAKEKKLSGARANLALRAYWPVASGTDQKYGVSIVAQEGSESSWEESREENAQESGTRAAHAGTYLQSFYGNMKWFGPADQPHSINDLPPEFSEAKALWDKDRDGNLDRIIELLSPFIGARFIPINISGWEDLFADPDGNGMVEVEASEIQVVGIDYSVGPIPICKAEAKYDVLVSDELPAVDLDDWQENNGPFTDAIVFYWDIPRNDETEDLDFTCGDNEGVECRLMTMNESLHADYEDEEEGGDEGEGDEADQLYLDAVSLVVETGRPSISLVQRHFGIGYKEAALLIERMEQNGIVSPMGAQGNREVIVKRS